MSSKAIKILIIAALLGVLIAFLIPAIVNHFKPVDKTNDVIRAKQAVIDSLSGANKVLLDQVKIHKQLADSFYNLSIADKKETVKIIYKRNEKIRSINNYNGNDLDSLFSAIKFKAN